MFEKLEKLSHMHSEKLMNLLRLAIYVVIFIASAAHAEVKNVSLVELILFPERYMGQEISLIGFQRDRVVYLTEDAAQYKDGVNSLPFADNREGIYDNCENAFVRITGILDPNPLERLYLRDVESIISLDAMAECKASFVFAYKS